MDVEPAGQLLRQARLRHNLSQAALSELSGVPQPAISRYEAGRQQPSFDAVRMLLAACGESFVVAPRRGQVDPRRAARHLAQVLDLAEGLPRRRRPDELEFPPLISCRTPARER